MKMISAGHIERASEFLSSDYEKCSSSDDSLGTDVGHLPLKRYNDACNMQSLTLLRMWIHYCTLLWLSSQTADRQQQTVNSCLSRHYF